MLRRRPRQLEEDLKSLSAKLAPRFARTTTYCGRQVELDKGPEEGTVAALPEGSFGGRGGAESAETG
jgi:hypothetical protein